MSARRVSPVKFSEARVADLVVRVVPVPGTPLILFLLRSFFPSLSFVILKKEDVGTGTVAGSSKGRHTVCLL